MGTTSDDTVAAQRIIDSGDDEATITGPGGGMPGGGTPPTGDIDANVAPAMNTIVTMAQYESRNMKPSVAIRPTVLSRSRLCHAPRQSTRGVTTSSRGLRKRVWSGIVYRSTNSPLV